jgi:hypothetical protein
MSGGHFDYKQYAIDAIVREIERLVKFNNANSVSEWGQRNGRDYSDETITKFKIAVDILSQAAIMAQRIDWLVCGDDGEETFHQRWDEDLTNLLGEDL